ncbi:MAG: hypothetical protein ABIE22_05625 [archaeon]
MDLIDELLRAVGYHGRNSERAAKLARANYVAAIRGGNAGLFRDIYFSLDVSPDLTMEDYVAGVLTAARKEDIDSMILLFDLAENISGFKTSDLLKNLNDANTAVGFGLASAG